MNSCGNMPAYITRSVGRQAGGVISEPGQKTSVAKRISRAAIACPSSNELSSRAGSSPVHTALEIRHSEVKISGGAGLGVFARKRGRSQVVFKKGQKIHTVKGALAMRLTNQKNKSLEWLCSRGRCYLLKKAGYVIWSSAVISRKKESLNFGIKPDDLTLYMNDAGRGAGNVTVEVDDSKFKTARTRKSKLKEEDLPSYVLKAKTPIKHGDEMLWDYSGGDSVDVDYDCAYQEDYDLVKATSRIKECVPKFLEGCSEIEMVDDEVEFNRLNICEELKSTDYYPSYTSQERALLGEMQTPSGRTRKKYLDRCLSDQTALNAYLKRQLAKKNQTITQTLGNIRTIFKSKFGKHSMFGLSSPFGFADLYGYCVEQKIIDPEKSVADIPFKWLDSKMVGFPGDPRYFVLLQKRLQLLLARDTSISNTHLTNLNHLIRNPLNDDGKWNWFDLEALANFPLNRANNSDTDVALIQAYKEKRDAGSGQKQHSTLKKRISNMARRGNLLAMKAIVERRLASSTLGDLAGNLKQSKIKLIVGGHPVDADVGSLEAFIKEQYGEEERKQFGCRFYSDEALLIALESPVSESMRARAGYEICKRIKEAGSAQSNLLKAYILTICRMKKTPSEVLRKLHYNGIRTASGNDYQERDVTQLFDEEPLPEGLKKVFFGGKKKGLKG